MSVTYDEILGRMKDEYTKLSGIVPANASDINLRMNVLAGEIYNSMVNVEWLKNQMFFDTAQGEFLTYHGAQRGIERREASCAQGEVVFYRQNITIKDTVIPQGVVVATQGENPAYFETVSESVIPATALSVHAEVKALKAGTQGNVPANKICVIVTPVAGVTAVKNPDACYSGSDAESDISLRNRIKESLKYPSNSTNCSYYKLLAEQVPSVSSASVVPRGRGAGTVDVYVTAQGADVSDEVLLQVQEKLSEMREVNVDVKVYKAQHTVVDIYLKIDVAEGYEFEDVKARCVSALNEYIATRGVGGSAILTEAGDRIQHTEGVREYTLSHYSNADVRCDNTHCPTAGVITVKEGVLL